MRLFSRKPRNKKKPARSAAPRKSRSPAIVEEQEGFDPYNTNPDIRHDELGLRRRDDRKWSF